MQCLCQSYTYLFIDVHSCISSVCQFINKAALFFVVYGNSLFYIKWMNKRDRHEFEASEIHSHFSRNLCTDIKQRLPVSTRCAYEKDSLVSA